MGVNKSVGDTRVKYTNFLIILLKRKPVLVLGSLFVVSLIFALMPDAAAAGGTSAGVGEFRLGEVLDESIGWFIVVGLGAIFAGVISAEIKMEEKYLGHVQSSEWFNTAGRIIKTGLTAAAIVSAWTWAATLLQSSTVAYLYGVSGPFWYASGATIQVLLFGILAIELKRKAPNAHTFLEIIRARFGNGTHKIFLGFALTCNMIVTGMLLLGGAAVVNGLTGMDITIAAFLIPVGVMVYTLVGGLKATFVADYMHTVIIYVVILTFVSMVFFISPVTGGIEGMYDKLAAAADLRPVMDPTFHPGGSDPGDSSTWGNAMGAYLTMASTGGSDLWCYQYCRKLWNCLCRPGLLATCNRCTTKLHCKRILARRNVLVLDSIYTCNNYGLDCCGAWCIAYARAGAARTYCPSSSISNDGRSWRNHGFGNVIHGCDFSRIC